MTLVYASSEIREELIKTSRSKKPHFLSSYFFNQLFSQFPNKFFEVFDMEKTPPPLFFFSFPNQIISDLSHGKMPEIKFVMVWGVGAGRNLTWDIVNLIFTNFSLKSSHWFFKLFR